jgi:ATP-dependent DNA ligase
MPGLSEQGAALLTRNGLDWTAKYPDIAAAIGALSCRQAFPRH